MANAGIHRQVESRLRTSDIRYTGGRRIVVEALADANGPQSAAELHAGLDTAVPLSTLYRTLTVLEEAEIVVPHFATKGVAGYELAEWLTGHHHHLVCIECGRVEDIDVPEHHEAQIDGLVNAITTEVGFVPTNHALEIEGICARCA